MALFTNVHLRAAIFGCLNGRPERNAHTFAKQSSAVRSWLWERKPFQIDAATRHAPIGIHTNFNRIHRKTECDYPGGVAGRVSVCIDSI